MAFGIIKVDTLTHSTEGSVSTEYVVGGSAKAWTNYNSDTTIRDSLNSSSITDHEVGEHSVVLTNNMANDDYAYSGGAKDGFNGNFGRICTNSGTASTSSHRQVTVLCNDNSRDDCVEVGTSVHGDLA
tara:strand:- start:207 stop:590 length:384 start_codon:yes stop_codon:yes gene_type:complete